MCICNTSLPQFPNEIELVETLLEKQEIFLRPSSSVRAHVLRLFAGEENGMNSLRLSLRLF
jgi:hypothetical protein